MAAKGSYVPFAVIRPLLMNDSLTLVYIDIIPYMGLNTPYMDFSADLYDL